MIFMLHFTATRMVDEEQAVHVVRSSVLLLNAWINTQTGRWAISHPLRHPRGKNACVRLSGSVSASPSSVGQIKLHRNTKEEGAEKQMQRLFH